MGALKPIIGNRNTKLKDRVMLYKTLVQPQLTYGFPSWRDINSKTVNKLQVFQNKCLRNITNAPWFVRNSTLHTDLNVKYISQALKEIEIKFFRDTEESQNPVIRQLSD